MTVSASPPIAAPRPCEDATATCRFTRKRVYFYLLVMRQAHLAHEPFDLVVRNRTRNSRLIEPGIRGSRADTMDARAIGWAIEDAGTRHGISVLNPHNADRLAKKLCPDHNEDEEESV